MKSRRLICRPRVNTTYERYDIRDCWCVSYITSRAPEFVDHLISVEDRFGSFATDVADLA
jgi:hypothetical protein